MSWETIANRSLKRSQAALAPCARVRRWSCVIHRRRHFIVSVSSWRTSSAAHGVFLTQSFRYLSMPPRIHIKGRGRHVAHNGSPVDHCAGRRIRASDDIFGEAATRKQRPAWDRCIGSRRRNRYTDRIPLSKRDRPRHALRLDATPRGPLCS